MIRLATFNVNGIRACLRRGFRTWLTERAPDVVALQEVRCPEDLVPPEIHEGYHFSYHAGEIPGRNGVALLTRSAPIAVRPGFGSKEFDHEGRYLEVDLDLGANRLLTVASLYLPKGGTPYEDEVSLARYERKLRFCRLLSRHLTRTRRESTTAGHELVIMGDFNIAPDERDVNNAKAKHKLEGFLPAERDWIATQIGPTTSRRKQPLLVDVVRHLRPDEQGPYSWWSWRGQAWANDAGWRIDHHLASIGLAGTAVAGGTDRETSYEARMSDHSPVVVDYEW